MRGPDVINKIVRLNRPDIVPVPNQEPKRRTLQDDLKKNVRIDRVDDEDPEDGG